MRNKVLNAIVQLLQNEIAGESSFKNAIEEVEPQPEEEAAEDNLIDTTQKGLAKKDPSNQDESKSLVSMLTLIGAIRILSQSNKKINIDWLNCLLKGDDYLDKRGSSLLSKQQAINQQQNLKAQSPLLEVLKLLQVQQKVVKDVGDSDQTEAQKFNVHKRRVLSRNLQPIVLESFKDFAKVLEKI